MRIYLDLNCFNRPFDDQTQARVAEETQAVEAILRRVVAGEDELVWSRALTFENSQHPLHDRRDEIQRWSTIASIEWDDLEQVRHRAEELQAAGFKALDALHIACAEAAGSERLLTCDDRMTRQSQRTAVSVRVQNPRDYEREVSHG